MGKVLNIPLSTYKRRRPSDLLTPGSEKWVTRDAPIKTARWKSKEEAVKLSGRADLVHKLAELSQPTPEQRLKALESFKKRAKAKYFTNRVVTELLQLDSPLKKSYQNTLFCSLELKQDGNKITTQYCKNRWCQVCNRIRVAKCINGYMPALEQFTDPQFVTLTIHNPKSSELREQIRGMISTWLAIYKKLHREYRQRKIKIAGIRKMECTYNAEEDTYHPHFHFIVDGAGFANKILAEWLDRYPNASHLGQHVTPANINTMKELFKYFTKVVTKTKTGESAIFIAPMDQIFQAIKGYRIYQPFGVALVNEEPDDLEAITVEELPDQLTWWKWNGRDWRNVHSGEVLSGFTDTDALDRLFKNIVL